MEVELQGFKFRSNFDSGAISRVDLVKWDPLNRSMEVNIKARRDNEGSRYVTKSRTWWNFGVCGFRIGDTLKVNIIDMNNQKKLYERGMRPVVTVMGRSFRLPSSFPCKHGLKPDLLGKTRVFFLSFSYTFSRSADEHFFSFSFPYPYEKVQTMLKDLEGKYCRSSDIYFHRSILATTRKGRNVDLVTITSYDGMCEEREWGDEEYVRGLDEKVRRVLFPGTDQNEEANRTCKLEKMKKMAKGDVVDSMENEGRGDLNGAVKGKEVDLDTSCESLALGDANDDEHAFGGRRDSTAGGGGGEEEEDKVVKGETEVPEQAPHFDDVESAEMTSGESDEDEAEMAMPRNVSSENVVEMPATPVLEFLPMLIKEEPGKKKKEEAKSKKEKEEIQETRVEKKNGKNEELQQLPPLCPPCPNNVSVGVIVPGKNGKIDVIEGGRKRKNGNSNGAKRKVKKELLVVKKRVKKRVSSSVKKKLKSRTKRAEGAKRKIRRRKRSYSVGNFARKIGNIRVRGKSKVEKEKPRQKVEKEEKTGEVVPPPTVSVASPGASAVGEKSGNSENRKQRARMKRIRRSRSHSVVQRRKLSKSSIFNKKSNSKRVLVVSPVGIRKRRRDRNGSIIAKKKSKSPPVLESEETRDNNNMLFQKVRCVRISNKRGTANGNGNGNTEKFPTSHVFTGKKIVYVTARVHPGEIVSSFMVDGLIKFLLHPTDPRALLVRKHFVFKIIPMLNPDGVYNGNYRQDLLGVNLNRVWGNPDPFLHETIFAAKNYAVYLRDLAEKIEDGSKVAMYLDLHGHALVRGCFCYGNSYDSLEKQVENVSYAKLLSINSQHFDFGKCEFNSRMTDRVDRLGSSREGTGRVCLHKLIGCLCYTIECNYNTGRGVNKIRSVFYPKFKNRIRNMNKGLLNVRKQFKEMDQTEFACAKVKNYLGSPLSGSPKYNPAIWESIGLAMGVSCLDHAGLNPFSRMFTPFGSGCTIGNVKNLRNMLKSELNLKSRLWGDSNISNNNNKPQQQQKKNIVKTQQKKNKNSLNN